MPLSGMAAQRSVVERRLGRVGREGLLRWMSLAVRQACPKGPLRSPLMRVAAMQVDAADLNRSLISTRGLAPTNRDAVRDAPCDVQDDQLHQRYPHEGRAGRAGNQENDDLSQHHDEGHGSDGSES